MFVSPGEPKILALESSTQLPESSSTFATTFTLFVLTEKIHRRSKTGSMAFPPRRWVALFGEDRWVKGWCPKGWKAGDPLKKKHGGLKKGEGIFWHFF